MSAPKGYAVESKLDRVSASFACVEPVNTDKFALSVLSHTFYREVATDAIDSATTSTITAAGHLAAEGDLIRFTSGIYSGVEIKVYSVGANTITLVGDLSPAPSAADTFQILRNKAPIVDASGNVSVTAVNAPESFLLNSVLTSVSEDTGTPANSRPLPVHLIDAAGNLNRVSATQSGVWNITNISGTISLPTGAATEATLAAASAKLPSTLGQKTGAASLAVVLASDQVLPLPTGAATEVTLAAASAKLPATLGQKTGANSLAVVLASDQTLPLPTGAATEATLAAQSAKLPATLGQKAMAASLAVVLASDQSAIPVSQSGTWNVTNISGTVSLPTGASTEATLAAASAKLPATLGQKAAAASLAVILASDQTLPLPSGAATSALQTTISGQLPATLGQKAMAASMAVVLASDQTSIPAKPAGLAYADSVQKASGTVTSGAWVQLIASTAAAAQGLMLFDSNGNAWELGIGAALSEVRKLIVPPGGFNGFIPLAIPAGSRVSARALSTTCDYTSSELDLTLIG